MQDALKQIFNDMAAAQDIKAFNAAIAPAAQLDEETQKEFLKRLPAEISAMNKTRGKDDFAVGHAHPLVKDDLSQGYHILFRAARK